jgi:hypothetical protein
MPVLLLFPAMPEPDRQDHRHNWPPAGTDVRPSGGPARITGTPSRLQALLCAPAAAPTAPRLAAGSTLPDSLEAGLGGSDVPLFDDAPPELIPRGSAADDGDDEPPRAAPEPAPDAAPGADAVLTDAVAANAGAVDPDGVAPEPDDAHGDTATAVAAHPVEAAAPVGPTLVVVPDLGADLPGSTPAQLIPGQLRHAVRTEIRPQRWRLNPWKQPPQLGPHSSWCPTWEPICRGTSQPPQICGHSGGGSTRGSSRRGTSQPPQICGWTPSTVTTFMTTMVAS